MMRSSITRSSCYSTLKTTQLADRVHRCLAAKEASGLSYDEIAAKLGITNAYCVQLFLGQAKLSETTATKLANMTSIEISSDDLQDTLRDFFIDLW